MDPTDKYANVARDANEALIARLKRERDSAYEALGRSERDFKTLHVEYKNAIAAIDRISKQLDALEDGGKNSDVTRALEKANEIVEVMLEHHKPAVLAEDGVDATDTDGVAYGSFIGVGTLRYGDLEVAAGALHAAMSRVNR